MAKISEERFWSILRENAGLMARTAKAIEQESGETYTRQAVYDRVKKNPELYNDILEENIDVAESELQTILRTSTSERNRLDAVKFYLKTIGKKRGYIEKQLHEHAVITEEEMAEQENLFREILNDARDTTK